MAFKDLYEHVQTMDIHINRNEIKAKAIEISGVDDVKVVRAGLDTQVCRGFWLTPTNEDHHLVKQYGCHVAVTARGLNRCWDRFVTVKEMMHLFDGEQQRTGNADQFEDLLSEFSSPMIQTSSQMVSEIDAFWRALSVLCPEKYRQEFFELKEKQSIDNYEIALRLRIPEQYVPRLFEARYQRWLNAAGLA